jgi:hypothetical protein
MGWAVMIRSACGYRLPLRVASSAFIAAARSSGSVRSTETMSSSTIPAQLVRSRIASVHATPGVWATRRIASVRPSGSAVDKGVDRRPDEAIARYGDRSGDADSCERVRVG